MEFRTVRPLGLLTAAAALLCIGPPAHPAAAAQPALVAEQRLDEVCLAVLSPGEAWSATNLDRPLGSALVLEGIDVRLSAIDREHGEAQFDLTLRATRDSSRQRAQLLFLELERAGEVIARREIGAVGQKPGEQVYRSSLTIPLVRFRSMCSEPPLPVLRMWLELSPTPPTPTPKAPIPSPEPIEATERPRTSPAPTQPVAAVSEPVSVRQLTRPTRELTSPAEFTLPLASITCCLQPSQHWPSTALADYICDDVSLKSVRFWKAEEQGEICGLRPRFRRSRSGDP